jgi:phosphoserine phosphatase RsbU/P
MPIDPSAASQDRVLIVDDDPGMLRAADRILSASYTTRAVLRPSEAIALAREMPFSLMVCDVRMPEMDGFALVEEVRKLQPGIDAIFMTGSLTEPDANLVRAIRAGAFYFIQKPFDRLVLSTLVSRCLELRRLRGTERAHVMRMERELKGARLLQQAMLGPARAEIDGIHIGAICLASQELGGDLYDFFRTTDGRAAFIIADVCGHGAPAALLTAVVKAAFRSRPDSFDPAAAIERLAADLAPFGGDRFVTGICGCIDRSGRLDIVNAGHPPGVLLHPRGEDPGLLPANSPLVSEAFESGSWSSERYDLPRGSTLALFTDGLHESFREPITHAHARLSGIFSQSGGDPAAMMSLLETQVMSELGGRPALDDITALAICVA